MKCSRFRTILGRLLRSTHESIGHENEQTHGIYEHRLSENH
jgi:hypothetical protein